MKGIVFTEFLEMVEDQFGIKTVQDIIDTCNLETKGVYTSVGTYDHKEMFQMVGKLSELEDIPVPDLLRAYGTFFFSVLGKSYPKFLGEKDLFTFLESIDGYIHPEVLKLYPDAELPRFSSTVVSNVEMELVYESSRKMADFAVGLIRGAGAYYETPINVEILKSEGEGEKAIIKIEKL